MAEATKAKWEVISSLYKGFSSAIVDDSGEVMKTLAEVRDYRVALMMCAAPDLYAVAQMVLDTATDTTPVALLKAAEEAVGRVRG